MSDDIDTLIDEVLRLDGEAMPGPWEDGENPRGRFSNETVVRPRGEFPHGEWVADCGSRGLDFRRSNATLIASYRSAAPRLARVLREVRRPIVGAGSRTLTLPEAQAEAISRLRAERDTLRAERDRLTGPEMRERIRSILMRLGELSNTYPEDFERYADEVMSLLRGEGR